MKSTLTIAAAAVVASTCAANAVTIDFEDGTFGSDVGAFYSGLGVTFSSDGSALNGPRWVAGNGGLAVWDQQRTLADGEPFNIRMDFSVVVNSLSMLLSSATGATVTLDAYDSGGGFIGSTTSAPNTFQSFQPFSYSSPTSIGYAILTASSPFSTTPVIDELTFEGNVVPLPATVWLMGAGLAGLGFAGRRRPKAK